MTTKTDPNTKTLAPLIRLMTPELRKAVEDRQEECYKLAEKHYKRDIPRPTEVRYDIKSRTAGIAMGNNVIRYNLILLFENKKDFIEQTVPHEVAHRINAICTPIPEGRKRLMPHGKEWKAIMTEVFKLPADRCHAYDTTSIQVRPRKAKTSRQRIQTAVRVITQVLKRVDTKFTPYEQTQFNTALEALLHERQDFSEAA